MLENGWALFQTEEEFAKLIHSADSDWRISYVNIDGSVSEIHVLFQNRKKNTSHTLAEGISKGR